MQEGQYESKIRDITGIRIHQLTLPQSLGLASKLVQEPAEDAEGYSLGGPSRLSSSPETLSILASSAGPGSRRARRESTSTLRPVERSPSVSAAPISPVGSTFRHRDPRLRSQTLAGEALEHGQGSGIPEIEQEQPLEQRHLARCFVVLKLAPNKMMDESRDPHSPVRAPLPRRFGSEDRVRQSVNGESPTRSRTSSSPPAPNSDGLGGRIRPTPSPLSSPNLRAVSESRTISCPGASPTRPNGTDPPSPLRQSSHTLPTSIRPSPSHRPVSKASRAAVSSHDLPFYISPIHRPSIYPRFLTLSPEDDFASWLSTEQGALNTFDLEVWYEDLDDGGKWRRADDLSRRVHLDQLQRQSTKNLVPPNTLEFTLSHDPKSIYYLAPGQDESADKDGNHADANRAHKPSGSRSTIYRPRHGLSVGGLLELINLQTVLVETERGRARVQIAIDSMLGKDVDWRAIRRDVKQREARCAWLEKAITHVDKVLRETQAHITLHDQANDKRRTDLRHAEEHADLIHGQCEEHRQALDTVESEQLSNIPLIHHYRMYHAQTLDAVFPIQSLHPQSLLYTILDIPLPIPPGPKEPAPHITVPAANLPAGYKVDERTNAAALGYAAMVVQLLGHIGGAMSGLPYPITCAGSRSLVKDVISIMQGPRSFPLYTKGVERYRFEYAVHMLNQDVEMLMQEANTRPLDVRQTLPNLKSLLLTLSSPVSTSHQSLASLGSKTAVTSRTSSRQTSYTFQDRLGYSPGGSVNGRDSPVSSRMGTGVVSSSPLSRIHERKSSLRPIKFARSLDDDIEEQLGDASKDSDDEPEKTIEDSKSHGIARRVVDA